MKHEGEGRSIQYLELLVSARNDVIDVAYSPKETALRTHLAVNSFHPAAVHASWPKGYGGRIKILDPRRAANVIHELASRLSSSYAAPLTIELFKKILCGSQVRSQTHAPRGARIWFKLPFHPILAQGMDRAVCRINNELLYLLVVSFCDSRTIPPTVGISWTSGGQNLQILVRNLHGRKDGDGRW